MKFQITKVMASVIALVVSSCFAQNSGDVVVSPEKVERIEVVGKGANGLFSYAKAYGYMTKFAALANKSKIDLAIYLFPNDGVRLKPSEVRINLQGDTVVAKVGLDSDWRLRIPINKAALDEGADFVVNQDLRNFHRPVRIEILPPTQATTPLRYYFDALDEVLTAERKLLTIFMPKKTLIEFEFDAGVKPKAEVLCDGGVVETFAPKEYPDMIAVPLDASWERRNCEVKFSPTVPSHSVPVVGK